MTQDPMVAQVLESWTPVKPGPDRGVVVRVVLQPWKKKPTLWLGDGIGAPLQKQHDLSKPRQRHQHQAQVPGQLVATAKTKTHFQHARNKTPNQQTPETNQRIWTSHIKRTGMRPVGASVREDFTHSLYRFRIRPQGQYLNFMIII